MAMQSAAVHRAFARRVQALGRELPAVADGDVEAVHRSRVASRRLREILPFVGPEGQARRSRDVRELRRRVRELTRALGGVRELDVALGLLDELRDGRDDLAAAIAATRITVEEERRIRRVEMAARLEDCRAFGLPDDLLALAGHLAPDTPADRLARLRLRLERRADRLDAAIEAAGALYAPDRLHLVRIAVKQLRYVLELVHEFGGVPTLRRVNRLKGAQEVLGRLHDLDVLAVYVRRHLGTGGATVATDVASLLRLIDRDIRQSHASYLARVPSLHEVIAACRGRVDERLAAAAPPHPRE
jgi:CHAD domain-containing protein